MDSANQASPTSRLPADFQRSDRDAELLASGSRVPNKLTTENQSSDGTTDQGRKLNAPGQAEASRDGSRPGSDGINSGNPTTTTHTPLPVPDRSLPLPSQAAAILKTAADAFARTGNWIVFYREVLGMTGLVRRTFETEAEQTAFQETPQFAELLEMVAALRSQDLSRGDSVEPEKMITIRLPESLHAVLADEADAMKLSINKLCISKLLQPVEGRFVPIQQGRRRGRKPGPQGSRKKTAQGKS
jgi:hypothetical protein